MRVFAKFAVFAVVLLGLSGCARIPVINWFFPERGINWTDTRWCVPLELKLAVGAVSRKYGPVIVTSTKRHRRENRLVGGARNSYHLKCRAVDFKVRSNAKASEIKRFLRRHPGVGGLSYYRRSGHFHIDNGPRRSW